MQHTPDSNANEEKFRTIAASAQDAIIVMDNSGNIAYWNAAAEAIFGYTAEEALGKEVHRFLAPPRFYPAYQKAFEHFRHSGEGAAVGKTLELAAVRKNGEEFPIELSLSAVRIENQWNAIGILRDISERKRAEKLLKESEWRFRSIYEGSNDAIMLLTEKGFFDCNWRTLEMFGLADKSAFVLLHPSQLSPPFQPDGRDSLSAADEKIATAFETGMNRFEWMHRRKNGEDFPAEVLLSAFDFDGTKVLQATVCDISERKRSEEHIRKLNEELEIKVQQRTRQLLEAQEELLRKEKLAVLGQVAGSVGHELRNPLGVMSNAVYFLQTVLCDADDTVQEYLNIIKDEITGAERIVSDLLDSVRTKPPHPEAIGVTELMAQVIGKCSIPPSVTVSRNIPDGLPPLCVDALQIHQVLRNLIGNAVEAMPQGGVLEIRADLTEDSKSVTISVCDSGIGMTPEHVAKLFQPLFTTKARGIGLGLVVVKNLTQANGGSIGVQSEAGKGSRFAVTFPTSDITHG